MKLRYINLAFIIILATIAIAGCGGGVDNRMATDGDIVSVHYTGTLEDGTEFDSSRGKSPLTFTIGGGQMITGFENAVRGMKVGEIKTVTLPPEEAYGQHRQDLVIVLGRDQFPETVTIVIGAQVQMKSNTGQQFIATIVEIGPGTVTIDANHELAGKTLTFEIELVSITPGGN